MDMGALDQHEQTRAGRMRDGGWVGTVMGLWDEAVTAHSKSRFGRQRQLNTLGGGLFLQGTSKCLGKTGLSG